MFFLRLFALLAATLPLTSHASEYPTTDRVEYVLQCMKDNDGKQEYLYKCSCAIDRIAKQLKYDDYVNMSTAHRYRDLGGERGALFRDPRHVKLDARRYNDIQNDAKQECAVRK